MLNCKDATRLISDGLEQTLGLPQRLSLRLHLFICHYCRNYSRQLRFLKRISPAIEGHIESHHEHQLPPETKSKIKVRLGENQRNSE